jgi:hypothetical protein
MVGDRALSAQTVLSAYLGGLSCPASPRAPPAGDLRVHDLDGNWEDSSASQEPRELTVVDEDTLRGDLLNCPDGGWFGGRYAPATGLPRNLPPVRRKKRACEPLPASHGPQPLVSPGLPG